MNAEMDNRSPLVGATFRVVAIDGLPVLPAPLADLSFDAEDNVGGCATINRLRGQYSLEGGAMAQEQRLFQALARVTQVDLDPEADTVDLRDAEGMAVVTLEYAVLTL